MGTAFKGRRFGLVLGTVGALCCALAAPARGDESQYLPNNAHLVMSANMGAFLNSKTFQELKKSLPKIADEAEKNIGEELGIPLANVARLSMGVAIPDKPGPENFVGMAATVKPVTAAAIKAMKKPRSYQTNVVYKEIKVADFTVYQQTFEYAKKDPNEKIAKVQEGEAFCVVESKLVVFGRLPSLTKILEQNKKPKLSANLKLGLKETGFTDKAMAFVVVDLENLPAWSRDNIALDLGKMTPAVKGALEQMRVLTIKGQEAEKVNGTATLYCKNAAGAADVKKAGDALLVVLKGKLVDDPTMPSQIQEAIKGARLFLDSTKLAVKGDTVTGSVSVAPATVAQMMIAIFYPVPQPAQPKESKKTDN